MHDSNIYFSIFGVCNSPWVSLPDGTATLIYIQKLLRLDVSSTGYYIGYSGSCAIVGKRDGSCFLVFTSNETTGLATGMATSKTVLLWLWFFSHGLIEKQDDLDFLSSILSKLLSSLAGPNACVKQEQILLSGEIAKLKNSTVSLSQQTESSDLTIDDIYVSLGLHKYCSICFSQKVDASLKGIHCQAIPIRLGNLHLRGKENWLLLWNSKDNWPSTILPALDHYPSQTCSTTNSLHPIGIHKVSRKDLAQSFVRWQPW